MFPSFFPSRFISNLDPCINSIIFPSSDFSLRQWNSDKIAENKINWYNRFKRVVGGRIINCYSKEDYILKLLYKNCTGNAPIGNSELIISNGLKGGIKFILKIQFKSLFL